MKLKLPKIPAVFKLSILGVLCALCTPRMLVVPMFYVVTLGPSMYGVHQMIQNAKIAKTQKEKKHATSKTTTS